MQTDASIEAVPPQDVIGPPVAGAMGSSLPRKQEASGYPLEIVGQVDEKFCCGYCKLLLRNPMQSTCGHRFCLMCITVMRTLPDPVICESCKKDEEVTDEESVLIVKDMFEDKAARREMKKLPARCSYNGCNWKGIFSDYIEHEEKCEKKLVNCSQCQVLVSKVELSSHKKKSCPKREHECQCCFDKIKFEEIENHDKICPNFKLTCEGCHQKIMRKEEEEHKMIKCANRVIECPVPTCDRKLPLNEFYKHVKDHQPLHFTYLFETCSNVLKQLKEVWTSVEQLKTAHVTATSVPVLEPVAASGVSQDVKGERSAGDGAQASDPGLQSEDRQKLKLHEDLMSVLHSEILKCITKGEALGRSMEKEEKRVRDLYTQYDSLLVKFSDVNKRFPTMERNLPNTSHIGELSSEGNGVFLWKLPSFSEVRRNACNNYVASVSSPCFFSEPSGYKMKLTLFPDGCGKSKSKYLSLFLEVVSGPYDDLLVWPFSGKVQFMLIDHKDFVDHHTLSSSISDLLPSDRGPSSAENTRVGSEEFILTDAFARHVDSYIGGDKIYLKARVDPSLKIKERMARLEFK